MRLPNHALLHLLRALTAEMFDRKARFVPTFVAFLLHLQQQIDLVEEDGKLFVERARILFQNRPAKHQESSHRLGCILRLLIVEPRQPIGIEKRKQFAESGDIAKDSANSREAPDRPLRLTVGSDQFDGKTAAFRLGFQEINRFGENVVGQNCVGIEGENVFAFCFRNPNIIAFGISVIVGFGDQNDPWEVFSNNFDTFVVRSVIDDNGLHSSGNIAGFD